LGAGIVRLPRKRSSVPGAAVTRRGRVRAAR
jgi:hypothetical protein